MSVAYSWGSTAEERAAEYPCDALLPDATDILFRAVDVNAPPAVIFRWLCQLRAAPYSYDWLDNGGRPSPRELTPHLDELECGQTVMTIFELVAFERDSHLTLALARRRSQRLFGELALSYVVRPRRVVVKLRLKAASRWRGHALAWGDLVMMRKQLLTLKALMERSALAASG
jgi:hypothetical protein